MMPMAPSMATTMISHTQSSTAGLLRALLIGLMAFLTVVDLFATQTILPALTRAYGTTPAVMSLAVNASTIGMAISGLTRTARDGGWRIGLRHYAIHRIHAERATLDDDASIDRLDGRLGVTVRASVGK